MSHTIPIAVLVRAAAALKAAKTAPTGTHLSVSIWHAVMISANELQFHLDILLKNQEVSVEVPA